MGLDPKVVDLVYKLKEKYESVGEDLADHLEGQLYSDYTNYWDYVGIDALLNLQKPKTKYPDEMTFIIYHQVTELFFKIILHELEQIGFREHLTKSFLMDKLSRINKYMDYLVKSFDVLVSSMEHEQFMHFRTALTPSSGFQSIQYRLIELWSTSFYNLVSVEYRDGLSKDASIEEMADLLYWKQGAIEKGTNKKTLTLMQFEEKYNNLILRKGNELKDKNLWYCFFKLPEEERDEEVIQAMKRYDINANINWPLAHYRYAAKYLKKGSFVARSTGGTNWQQYLPPHFQKQIFFPQLWSKEEKENWGRSWVESIYMNE